MSGRATGIAWEADLPRPELLVLLAYSDHADHLGRNSYPGTRLLSWMTGYDRSSVIRIRNKLIKKRILKKTGVHSEYGSTVYDIMFEAIPRKEPLIWQEPGRPKKGSQNTTPFSEKGVEKGSHSYATRSLDPKNKNIKLGPNSEQEFSESFIDRHSEAWIEIQNAMLEAAKFANILMLEEADKGWIDAAFIAGVDAAFIRANYCRDQSGKNWWYRCPANWKGNKNAQVPTLKDIAQTLAQAAEWDGTIPASHPQAQPGNPHGMTPAHQAWRRVLKYLKKQMTVKELFSDGYTQEALKRIGGPFWLNSLSTTQMKTEGLPAFIRAYEDVVRERSSPNGHRSDREAPSSNKYVDAIAKLTKQKSSPKNGT